MKIVFIGGRDVNIIGGIENYMLNLSTHLVKLGHVPIVFCEGDRDYEEIVNGFQVIHVKGPKNPLICKPYVGLKATLKVVFSIKDIDVIHYNAWPPSLWSFIPRLKGIPSLMQGHGLEWQRSKYSPFQRKMMKFMEFVTAHTNQHLFMCCEDQTEYFKSHYGKKAVTIPTAINIPSNNRGIHNNPITQRLGLQNRRYFLFLARLVKDKNPHILIKAFKNIENNGYKLVIAGDNPSNEQYVENLKTLAKSCSDIIFTGAVLGEDKRDLFENAFVFCIPSTIEGLSIALLEAMSYKIPIIASNIKANKEVLDKSNALWVEPEDEVSLESAIKYAINNPETILGMVTANYNKVKNSYTWEHITKRYINYLETIVHQSD